jgi:predicted RNA-binding protein
MAYLLNLFSPETYEAFGKSEQEVSGFRARQKNAAGRVKIGDKLICYMTKVSRWFGIVEVISDFYIDDTPILYPEDDPFIVRFKVKPIIWLPKEQAIPIREDKVWEHLSFTKGVNKSVTTWTGKIRSSLSPISKSDGEFLENLLTVQNQEQVVYPIDTNEYEKWIRLRVRTLDKVVAVSIPENNENTLTEKQANSVEVRESIKMQSLIAYIGAAMGMKIWLPRNDRSLVMQNWTPDPGVLLEKLPLNYDETTLRTIEQIDVLWFKGRSIVRAFEVEHTTSIYSGILRMADLIALQPNMNINLHIVAPAARRDKVFQEITRPVFAFLERPLHEICTYISYDSLQELSDLPHLAHQKDSVLDEYAEEPE